MKREIDFILVLYLSWALFILFVILSSTVLFRVSLDNVFLRWDAGHFIAISEFGYREEAQYAFFPLFPLIVGFLSNISRLDFIYVALFLNLNFLFLGLFFLNKLILRDFNRETSKRAIFLLLVFPFSFYYFFSYSESLFLFLSVACFYYLRRHKFLTASLLISLAGATRLIGLVLLVPLFIELLGSNEKKYKQLFFILIGGLGFLSYCIFLYSKTGNPLMFLASEGFWQRGVSLPDVAIINSFSKVFHEVEWYYFFIYLGEFMCLVIGLGLSLRSFRVLRPSYSWYSLLSLLVPLVSGSLTSLPRFLSVLFPVFIILSLIKNKIFFRLYVTFSVLLLVLSLSYFIQGFWVS